MKLSLALAVCCLVPAAIPSQAPPDLFSCVDPARLSAPRSATYAVKASGNYTDVEEVARIEETGRTLLRITRTRYQDGTMTSAQVLHVDARSLAPISYLHSSARTPEAPPARLAIQGATLTGHSYGAKPVAAQTSGQPILFGNAPEEMLAAAVDWNRCPAVSGMQLNSQTLDLRRELTMTRTGETAFTLDGRTLDAYEILIEKNGSRHTIAVSKAAPFVMVKTIHAGQLASVRELIKFTR